MPITKSLPTSSTTPTRGMYLPTYLTRFQQSQIIQNKTKTSKILLKLVKLFKNQINDQSEWNC